MSLLFILGCVSRADAGQQKKNILVLHSFHQGYEWTDSVQQGILDEMAPRRKDVSLSVEYLDSIRSPEASHWRQRNSSAAGTHTGKRSASYLQRREGGSSGTAESS